MQHDMVACAYILYYMYTDINECLTAVLNNIQLCIDAQFCENTPGSFQCQCPPGTQLNTGGERCEITPSPTSAAPSAPATSAPTKFPSISFSVFPSVTPTTTQVLPPEAIIGIVIGAVCLVVVLLMAIMAIIMACYCVHDNST